MQNGLQVVCPTQQDPALSCKLPVLQWCSMHSYVRQCTGRYVTLMYTYFVLYPNLNRGDTKHHLLPAQVSSNGLNTFNLGQVA